MVSLGRLFAGIAGYFGYLYDEAKNYVSPFNVSTQTEIYMLGTAYKAESTPESMKQTREVFLKEFTSLFTFTYRKGFAPLTKGVKGKSVEKVITDEGWGSAIRSYQMLTAKCLYTSIVDDGKTDDVKRDIRTRIIGHFADVEGESFSIHESVKARYGLLKDYEAGRWTKEVSVGSLAVQHMWIKFVRANGQQLETKPKMIYQEAGDHLEVSYLVSQWDGEGGNAPMSIFLRINTVGIQMEEKIEAVLELFTIKGMQGLVGADGTRAFYIPAASRKYLYTIDPHVYNQAPLTDAPSIAQHYVPQKLPRRMRWARLHAEFTVAFTVKSKQELDDLIVAISNLEHVITRKGDKSLRDAKEVKVPLISLKLPTVPEKRISNEESRQEIVHDSARGNEFINSYVLLESFPRPEGSGNRGGPRRHASEDSFEVIDFYRDPSLWERAKNFFGF